MIRMNLLPVREARRKASQRQQVALLGGAVGIGLVAVVGLHMMMQARISSAREEISRTERELTKLQETLGDVEDFRKKKEDIQRKLGVISDLQRSRNEPVKILDEIATRIPERVWLTSLTVKSGTVDMAGFGLDNEVIAAFMTSLEESPYLTSLELLETQLEDKKALKLNRFKIRARQSSGMKVADAGGDGKNKAKRKGRGKRRR
jgi:type IV pilus assembly protein PilN